LCDLNASNFGLVADNGFSVQREAHVEFKTVAAIGHSLIERGKGVFRDRL